MAKKRRRKKGRIPAIQAVIYASKIEVEKCVDQKSFVVYIDWKTLEFIRTHSGKSFSKVYGDEDFCWWILNIYDVICWEEKNEPDEDIKIRWAWIKAYLINRIHLLDARRSIGKKLTDIIKGGEIIKHAIFFDQLVPPAISAYFFQIAGLNIADVIEAGGIK